jgi:DNA polymerase III alpha subunit
MNYAELHCLSNFSFQRGASSALELFERAKRQGYSALAITDECTLSGIVRAWQAAKAVELPLIIGSEVRIEHGPKLVLLVQDLSGYQHLCRLITLARRRAEKGSYRLLFEDFEQQLPGLLALWVAEDSDTQASIQWLRRTFADRLWLAVPVSQELPADWDVYYIDVRGGSVRGGMRGSGISPEFLEYEHRHAQVLGMPSEPWAPKVLKADGILPGGQV